MIMTLSIILLHKPYRRSRNKRTVCPFRLPICLQVRLWFSDVVPMKSLRVISPSECLPVSGSMISCVCVSMHCSCAAAGKRRRLLEATWCNKLRSSRQTNILQSFCNNRKEENVTILAASVSYLHIDALTLEGFGRRKWLIWRQPCKARRQVKKMEAFQTGIILSKQRS